MSHEAIYLTGELKYLVVVVNGKASLVNQVVKLGAVVEGRLLCGAVRAELGAHVLNTLEGEGRPGNKSDFKVTVSTCVAPNTRVNNAYVTGNANL